MKVIVDTSIWIDFFHDNLSISEKMAFAEIVELEQLLLTEVIYHELLIGSRSKSEFNKLRDWLDCFPLVSLDRRDILSFVQFGLDIAKSGLMGKYTDSLISFHGYQQGALVWSRDKFFTKLADKKFIKLLKVHA